MSKKTAQSFGLVFLIGIVFGYLASLFMPEKTTKKQSKFVKDKANQLKEIFTDPDQRERIVAIFSNYTQRAVDTYTETKALLIDNLTALSGTLSEINKDKYIKALNKALDQVKKDHKIPSKQLASLKKYLTEDFSKLKNFQSK